MKPPSRGNYVGKALKFNFLNYLDGIYFAI